MNFSLFVFAFALIAAGGAFAQGAANRVLISATSKNPVAEFDAAVAALGKTGGVVEFERGEYRFPLEATKPMRFYISNHDQSDVHHVLFPIVGARNLVVEGNGSTFIFEGAVQPFVIMDSQSVTLRNFALDSATAFMPELTVTGFRDGKTLATLDQAKYPHRVSGGQIRFRGKGWEYVATHAKLFDGTTREMVERSGDIFYRGEARELPTGELELDYDFSKRGRGAKVGDVVVLRPGPRTCPAFFVDGSRDTVLEDVAVHSSLGVALLAQRSENVAWRGSGRPESRRCGVFPRKETGRYASAHADATHFSNVKGAVAVENCLFEAMMDDAINVHSTCLYVTNVVAKDAIRCRYMHPQAVGFDVFRPGEKLRFIDGDTLETGPVLAVKSVERHDAREVTITLDRPIPDGFGAGDAVENADYQCSAVFRGNVVRFNRARGALLTTPKPVLVESNLFDRVTGCALLLSGDAHYWFESGACDGVTIRGNVFRNCLTCYRSHESSYAVIAINPVVHDIARQKRRYHRNVRIVGNRFETFDVPLLYAYSADGIRFEGNEVVRNDDYAGVGQPPFIVKECENVAIDEAAKGK